MTQQPYLRVREVAQRLAVSVPTVWRWTRERSDFPKPIKLGQRATRWRVEDLEKFEASL